MGRKIRMVFVTRSSHFKTTSSSSVLLVSFITRVIMLTMLKTKTVLQQPSLSWHASADPEITQYIMKQNRWDTRHQLSSGSDCIKCFSAHIFVSHLSPLCPRNEGGGIQELPWARVAVTLLREDWQLILTVDDTGASQAFRQTARWQESLGCETWKLKLNPSGKRYKCITK